MSKQKLVVIGNGMAPGKALETLIDLAPDAYDITIFNAEPRVNYNRIMLSPVLSGESTFEEIIIHGDGNMTNCLSQQVQRPLSFPSPDTSLQVF